MSSVDQLSLSLQRFDLYFPPPGEADNNGVNRNIPAGGMMTSPEQHEAQARRKLYFNPAYFEPELLQTPPPAALEFLARIREMITVAKTKMKTKIYHPSLGDIP